MGLDMTLDIGQLLVVGAGMLVSWAMARLGRKINKALENAEKVPELEQGVAANKSAIRRLFSLTDNHDTRLTVIETRHQVKLERASEEA